MLLLKNGTIIDGTGETRYKADLLIEDDKIKEISREPLNLDCKTVDCSNLIISPGFIDMHSHNDWFVCSKDEDYYINPFIRQGITSFVTGNCGFGVAGLKEKSEHIDLLESNLFKEGVTDGIKWRSYKEYFNFLQKKGIKTNIATLAGSGTTRASISGYDAKPLDGEVLEEYLNLLEQALIDGAKGVSFGMGYAPDIFSNYNEQVEVAKLVKRYDGFVSVHMKAFSKVSAAYPLIPFGQAHNIKALKEFIRLARDTGVRLQLSHLIFVGEKSWKTITPYMDIIDRAIREGLDIEFDTYFHHCGATVITGILPDWFMEEVPQAYSNKKLLKKIKTLMSISFKLLGFSYKDMKLASANIPELEKFNGLYLSEIAQQRGLSNFDNYIDIASRSNSSARLLIDKYSNPSIISTLMRHPKAHFMTDAWVEPSGLQNPATASCFPGFIRKSIDEAIIPIEECIYKMTGANAKRAKIEKRGVLEAGNFADITIFDPYRVTDSSKDENIEETGIVHVFINGEHVLDNGQIDDKIKSGRII
ncbi:MAG: hypothetical protein JXR63_05070 [Spirochaetales bacterium]|nr:hypothetical protein [Spirochaetales bacterium]